MAAMSIRGISVFCAVGLGLGGLAARAHAQEAPPFDPAIEIQLFDYALGPKTFFAVNDARIMAPKQFTFDFLVTFLSNPFTVYNVDDSDDTITDERTAVVERILAGDLSGAYGLNDRFQLGVSLPMTFQMAGDGLMPTSGGPAAGGLRISGTGDLRVELKMKAYQEGAIGLAAAVGATAPTSRPRSTSVPGAKLASGPGHTSITSGWRRSWVARSTVAVGVHVKLSSGGVTVTVRTPGFTATKR